MFELFANVQEMVVDTFGVRDYYPFKLERLSQYAFPKKLKMITVKGKWLKDAFTDSAKQIFSDKGWDTQLEAMKDQWEGDSWKLKLKREEVH